LLESVKLCDIDNDTFVNLNVCIVLLMQFEVNILLQLRNQCVWFCGTLQTLVIFDVFGNILGKLLDVIALSSSLFGMHHQCVALLAANSLHSGLPEPVR